MVERVQEIVDALIEALGFAVQSGEFDRAPKIAETLSYATESLANLTEVDE